jgi:peptidoglycan/xylan/chitin deacetylase (PgdA/CDA1 family)
VSRDLDMRLPICQEFVVERGEPAVDQRRVAYLTVDLEDYRRHERRDHLGFDPPPHPDEVAAQLERLLEIIDEMDADATFFTVGRLANELPGSVWPRIIARHKIGCHGHEHLRVARLGAEGFRADLERAKKLLEDCVGNSVCSFRAPYFSCDGCLPWFGEVLARTGFRIDSSMRLSHSGPGFVGTMPLPGSEGLVTEVPLASFGVGSKRLTVIGGTYFRLLSLSSIRWILRRAEARGFVPVVYLHPYDVDPRAAPLDYPRRIAYLGARAGDWVRRKGRGSVRDKLLALARDYAFRPVESILDHALLPEAGRLPSSSSI